ncbi:triosephosphate isomerase [Actibacterium atlanticum]|uniref:Triosephosphate isomerase n=1 Tax=Actibacterium atlanticum TaxID=1461693 RepID=A0A058ZNM7_9RHOB|nr:triose-phosphate isomerase [Actibacterium atlanticum]KCV82426.1 triosephosphate isomerase [Actibacterium atlanticum]
MKKTVVGNWKMNGSGSLLSELAKLSGERRTQDVDVVVCPPSVYLKDAAAQVGEILVGGQDCSEEVSGAFTGDISAKMIRDCGAMYVLAGHSERRMNHSETNETVARKVAAAQAEGLTPILCIGETKEERLVGATLAVLHDQLAPCLDADVDLEDLIIAYEPIWSIGTGNAASVQDIFEIMSWIKDWLCKQGQMDQTTCLYGGSVKASNAFEVLSLSVVDGVLVGGASLNPIEFAVIVDEAGRASGAFERKQERQH